MVIALIPLKAFGVLGAIALGIAQPSTEAVEAPPPVQLHLYDVNHREETTVLVGRDGSVDPKNEQEIKRLFRCRRTDRSRSMDNRLLALLADLQLQYPGKSIHFISGYRNYRGESRTSPHRAARALDLSIPGVSTKEIRDYLWRTHRGVGVGWYPQGNYVHLDMLRRQLVA
jgi:uncharacterized protein YcbK (DUF882 family)